MAAFMQRNSSPQPYPYYHYKQQNNKTQLPLSTIQNCIQINNNSIGNSTIPSYLSQAIIVENERQKQQDNGDNGTTFFSTNRHQRLGGDRLEKIPLVQKWSPSGGLQTTKKITISPINSARHMGKSMSLDTTVSIAHV